MHPGILREYLVQWFVVSEILVPRDRELVGGDFVVVQQVQEGICEVLGDVQVVEIADVRHAGCFDVQVELLSSLRGLQNSDQVGCEDDALDGQLFFDQESLDLDEILWACQSNVQVERLGPNPFDVLDAHQLFQIVDMSFDRKYSGLLQTLLGSEGRWEFIERFKRNVDPQTQLSPLVPVIHMIKHRSPILQLVQPLQHCFLKLLLVHLQGENNSLHILLDPKYINNNLDELLLQRRGWDIHPR